MKLVYQNPNPSGAYSPIQEGNYSSVPNGMAVWPDTLDTADFYAYNGFVTLTVDGLDITLGAETVVIPTVTACTPNTEAWEEWKASLPEEADPLPAAKAEKIAQSKTDLATWLEANPLLWTDGKYYSVTEEKQTLLMGNIAAYQIEVQSDPGAVVTWNATGEECVEWDINDLCALAVAIKNYVKPRVSYQQSKEVQINACETVEDVAAVVVDYDTLE